MSLLSGIVSDIKSVTTDPGKIAKDICDAVLPQNMKAVGDVVGGALDVETGNPLQALSHMADALKDLPQMAQGLPGTTASNAASTPGGTAGAEPTPPPARAPSLQQVITELTALAGGGKPAAPTTAAPAPGAPPATTTTAAAPAATGAAAAPTTTAAATAPATIPATTIPAGGAPPTLTPRVSVPLSNSSRDQVSVSMNVGGTTVTVTESVATPRRSGPPSATRPGWLPTRMVDTIPTSSTSTSGAAGSTTAATATASPAPAASAASSVTGSAAGSTSSTPAGVAPAATTAPGTASATTSSATAAASPTATAAAGSTTTPSSLSSLMSMSNDQFMQAVTSGNIPADVASSPSAMAEIQARMNQITQMNQLVTSMMAAMHQMQMAIIQNIRA